MKCIVKDCENHNDQGGFTGNLCNPCYQFITAGKGKYSQAYRNANPVELTDEEREMNSDKKNINKDSLENLLIALMSCKDEDGLLLNINPANAFQDWLIEMYPESMRQHWFNLHTYVKAQEK